MNIKDYATTIINMNSPAKRNQAIALLENGLKHEAKWNDIHKREVRQLIDFLSSWSNNIDELQNYCPTK